MSISLFILILSLLLVTYVYILYPVILYVLTVNKSVIFGNNEENLEKISVLIAAYNEEDYIYDCIHSVIKADYPQSQLEILVGSDGSTDKTDEIIKKIAQEYENVKYFRLDRAGKNSVLNHLSDEMSGSIMLVLDADCRIKTESLKQTNAILKDKVGCLVYSVEFSQSDDNTGSKGESFYQKYDSFLRERESLLKSNINSLGSHAIRKELFQKFPNDKVCDDLYSLLVTIQNKKKVIFSKKINIVDVRERNFGEEYQRRKRLVGGGLATIFSFPKLLSPTYGWTSLFLWSHKILRWYSSILLLLAYIASFFILDTAIGAGFMYFFTITIVLSVIGYVLEKNRLSNPLKLPLFFISMNIGFVEGIIQFYKKKQNAIWSRKGLE